MDDLPRPARTPELEAFADRAALGRARAAIGEADRRRSDLRAQRDRQQLELDAAGNAYSPADETSATG